MSLEKKSKKPRIDHVSEDTEDEFAEGTVPDLSSGMRPFRLMSLRYAATASSSSTSSTDSSALRKQSLDVSVGSNGSNMSLQVLDQRQLPDTEFWITCSDADVDDMFMCIKEMAVRGAPMIGIAAAMALAQYATRTASQSTSSGPELSNLVRQKALHLRQARPTAVNLMYCVDKIVAICDKHTGNAASLAEQVRVCAYSVKADEQNQCLGMARLGAALVGPDEGILTHCNTGSLATAGVGTALGVIRAVHRRHGDRCRVLASETRPLLQGGRLTAYELTKSGIPFTLICDNMAATLMRDGSVTRVFVGADRIARNGDSANKIGTYSLAVLCQAHGVPFHIVAPSTTVDLECPEGSAIPIEQRRPEEVRGVCANVSPLAGDAAGSAHQASQEETARRCIAGGVRWAPANCAVTNPAFDVTPARLITSWVFGTCVVTNAELAKQNHRLDFIFSKK